MARLIERDGMRLGEVQHEVLRSLFRHAGGRWTPYCQWIWGSTSKTDRILASLVKRGYVKKTGEHESHKPPHLRSGWGEYRITRRGIVELTHPKGEQTMRKELLRCGYSYNGEQP